MKKIFASILAVAMSMSMYASITSNIRLTLVSESEYEAYVELKAGSDYSSFDPTKCSTYFDNLSNTKNIGMYAIYESANYSNLAAAQFMNVPLVVVTSREAAAKQNYWLYVDVLGGAAQNIETLTITDLRAEGGAKTVAMTDALTDGLALEFSLDEETAYTEGTNSVIANRFVINYDQSTYAVTSVTTNEDGWASFAYTADVAPADPSLAVYKGALNNSDPENPAIVLTAVTTGIPAGEGVFVLGEPLTTYYFSATTATAFSGNDLVGCTAATDPAGISDAIYTLRNVGGVTGLYNYVGTAAIPAGKAYLPIPVSGSNPAPARVRMVINGAQGIEEVQGDKEPCTKFIENGQIFIMHKGTKYNVQGQIVK
ncbi:MAG: hypothetical protein IJ249_06325 [Paludibacteraceae bacterium]|nr:hypothetical protein [Paludibacteraceae bacterium]